MALISLYQDAAASLSTSSLALLIISITIAAFTLYHLYFDPLRHVPGPLLCRFTSAWIWYHSYVGDDCRRIDAFFARYGPIVRIAPNEVVLADGAALAPIYSDKGGFRKAPCYTNFDFDGHATIFSTRNADYRKLRSKPVLPLFSTSALSGAADGIEACVDRFVARVRREANESRAAAAASASGAGAGPRPVNLLNLSRSLAIDSVSAYLFGEAYGGMAEETGRMSASAYVDSAVAIGRVFYLPNWMFRTFETVLETCFAGDAGVNASVGKVNAFAEKVVANARPDDNTYQGRLLQAGISKHETEVQCKDLIFAGTDSTGNNVAKVLWYLTRQPETYRKLRAEIARADADDPSMNPQAIRYLDAVVREGLRLSMANPTRFPREVPPSGWTFTSKDHRAFPLPPGTLVGLQPFSLHTNPAVFPDPWAFRPERWIDGATPEMQRDWFPFGLGARQCIARNMATVELLLTVRAVARANLLEGARAVQEEIAMLEWFNSKVVGDRIDLVWE